jgi:diguanylate cyclase (GGDEF)-like protein
MGLGSSAMDELTTDRQARRRLALVTVVSVAISAVITLAATAVVFGVDPTKSVPVSLAYQFGMTMAVLVPLLVSPLISYKINLAMHERDRAHVELHRLAATDQMTGLLNRRGIDAALTRLMSERLPYDQPMSVMMIDIDFFKALNDRFGHEFGDVALIHVAAILRDEAGAGGFVVGRQGGEEFIAIVPGLRGPQAVGIAERLRTACAAAMVEHDGKSTSLTISIGVASGFGPHSLRSLVSEADSALYRAKQNGRNSVVLHQRTVPLHRVA